MEERTVEVRNGLKFRFHTPGSEKEYNDLAKRGDRAMLDDACDNNLYRTGLPDGWGQLADALFKEHKIAKKTKPHPDPKRSAKGDVVVNETNPAYVDRVMSEQDLKLDVVQKIVDSFGVLELDLTERRGQGGALVGKADLDLAASFLDAGDEKLNLALERMAGATGDPKVELTGDRDTDQRLIALAIKSFKASAAKQLAV